MGKAGRSGALGQGVLIPLLVGINQAVVGLPEPWRYSQYLGVQLRYACRVRKWVTEVDASWQQPARLVHNGVDGGHEALNLMPADTLRAVRGDPKNDVLLSGFQLHTHHFRADAGVTGQQAQVVQQWQFPLGEKQRKSLLPAHGVGGELQPQVGLVDPLGKGVDVTGNGVHGYPLPGVKGRQLFHFLTKGLQQGFVIAPIP